MSPNNKREMQHRQVYQTEYLDSLDYYRRVILDCLWIPREFEGCSNISGYLLVKYFVERARLSSSFVIIATRYTKVINLTEQLLMLRITFTEKLRLYREASCENSSLFR